MVLSQGGSDLSKSVCRNNPCLLRQLRMPMQGSQMVSKSLDLPPATPTPTPAVPATPQAPHHGTTWEVSEDTIPPLEVVRHERPRSSLEQDGSEFMKLLDSLEERVELMSKMQETRQRLQEAREPAREPEAIQDGGYPGYRGSDQLEDEQEESGAQLLYDQLQHLAVSPTAEALRWCRPDLLQQDAQHQTGNSMADAICAADVRKLCTELERHLEESTRLRQELKMQQEESMRLQAELEMERQKHQQAAQDWMQERELLRAQLNEMQKRLEAKMAKPTSHSGSSSGGESGGSARGGVVRICTLQDMSSDPSPNQAQNFEAVESGFSLCGSNIAVSEDRLVATRTRGNRQSMVLGSSPLRKVSEGWYYEVRLREVETGWTYAGFGGLGIGVTKQSPSQNIRVPDKAVFTYDFASQAVKFPDCNLFYFLLV
eukprot:s146_g25.t1